MNVGELKKLLEQYPDDMEIVNSRYSDYCKVEPSDWELIDAVDQGYYVMEAHPTMSEENKRNIRTYLHLIGN